MLNYMYTKQLKIAFLIDQLRIGGTEKQLVALANLLKSKNHFPHVFSLREHKQGLQKKLDCDYYNLNLTRIRSLSFLEKLFEFVQLLKKFNFDILQTFFHESSMIGTLAGRLAQIPCIITSRRDMGAWHNKINKINIRISNFLAHKILANSFAVKNYICQIENVRSNKIDVIYNGIDLSKYIHIASSRKFSDEKECFKIGIISNFSRKVKRFDLFAGAMNLLLRKYMNISVLVVGEVPTSMKNEISKEFSDKFYFTGVIDNVCDYLREIDIGIICSDSEGFSNVILEYMASGIPCVCTKTGGNIEIINDGIDGLLFAPGDSLSLANKISYLIEKPELMQRFSLTALEKIKEKFSWTIIITEYIDYYQHMLVREKYKHYYEKENSRYNW